MHYKLAPLILTPGKNSSTTSDIFIAQPDSIKEAFAGKLFILIEIESKKQDSLKVLNFLIDNIDHNYYQNEKILLREKISTLKVEHIFEASLAKTNKNFSEFLQQEKIKIELSAINVIAGIIYEDEIHFVNSGKNKAYLIYRHKIEGKKKGKIKEDDIIEYKISDIIEQAGANKKNNDDKLFTNVISGKIPKRGHFIITNEALPEYISTKQLTKIATTLPPVGAVEQMKNILENINSYVTFLGILIKSTTIEGVEKAENINNVSTQQSISSLNQTEATTENLLSPSGVINPKQWVKIPDFISDRGNKLNKTSLERPFVLKDKIFSGKKSSFSFFNKIFGFLKNIVYHSTNLIQFFGGRLAKKSSQLLTKNPITIENTPNIDIDLESENILEKSKNKLSSLFFFPGLSSRKNRILLGVSLIFIALFFINISLIKSRNAKKIEIQNYENAKAEIIKKQDQAESYLLYDDKNSAKNIFTEINTLLSAFPQTTAEQKKQYQEFKIKFDTQNEKINNVVRLNNLTEIANLKNTSASAKGKNIILSQDLSKIYIADSSQNSIYILDLKDNSVSAITDASISQLDTPTLADNNKIYYLSQNSIVELDSNNSINKLSINSGSIDSNYSAAANYNGKLYLLNSKANQIYKFNLTGSTFDSGKAWINKTIDLSDGVDMAIDGNVYVLRKNGEIIKLLKGDKKDLTLEKISPIFNNATAFAIGSVLKFIYILEPDNKRLVVFDKNGKFISQYLSDKFTNLKDFAIDEKNKTIYFLNDNSVYKVQATHL